MESKWSKVIIHSSAYFAPFLVPLLFFLVSKEEEVKKMAVQSIIFQIVMAILLTISVVLSFFIIGIPLLLIFGLMVVIVPIVGIVAALRDKEWGYPIVKHFIK